MKTFKQLAVLAVLFALLISCCDCPSGPPENIITKEQANKMKVTYNEFQYEYINNGLEQAFTTEQKDNNAVLFTDVDDLQKYLQAIKKQSKKDGDEDVAVAIVFGAAKNSDGLPMSTIYLQAAGVPKGEEEPFDWSDYKLKFIPGSFADKGHPIIIKKDSVSEVEKGSNSG